MQQLKAADTVRLWKKPVQEVPRAQFCLRLIVWRALRQFGARLATFIWWSCQRTRSRLESRLERHSERRRAIQDTVTPHQIGQQIDLHRGCQWCQNASRIHVYLKLKSAVSCC